MNQGCVVVAVGGPHVVAEGIFVNGRSPRKYAVYILIRMTATTFFR